jgi:hypothetical protein
MPTTFSTALPAMGRLTSQIALMQSLDPLHLILYCPV